MKKISLINLDSIQKEELLNLKGGGVAGSGKKCACICVGPLEPGEGGDDDDEDHGGNDDSGDNGQTSDGDCADCGASNAFRVTNGG